MKASFQIVACAAGDELFSKVLPVIYGEDHSAHPREEVDSDYPAQCLVVVKGTEVLGRMAVYQNPSLTHLQNPAVVFGNFECLDNMEAAKVLLGAGLSIAGSLGATTAIGPVNGSTWSAYRFISERGDAPLFFTEPLHPAYYPALWLAAGFVPFQQYLSDAAAIPSGFYDASAFFAAHHLAVRGIDVPNLARELDALHPLCSAAFVKNPLSAPISKQKFIAKLMPLQPLLNASFTKIITDGSGAPVAFILCLPDIFDKTGRTLVLKTAAKHPACAVPGLMSEPYRGIMAEAYRAGYRRVIHAFIHVDNTSLQRSRYFRGEPIRQYSLYMHLC